MSESLYPKQSMVRLFSLVTCAKQPGQMCVKIPDMDPMEFIFMSCLVDTLPVSYQNEDLPNVGGF